MSVWVAHFQAPSEVQSKALHFRRLIKSNYHHTIETLRNQLKGSKSEPKKNGGAAAAAMEEGEICKFCTTRQTNSLRSMKASHISKLPQESEKQRDAAR